MTEPLNVLFLCTRNSARSIFAEALLNHKGKGKFQAFSAGGNPAPEPHRLAIKVLNENGIATAGLHSKKWDMFAMPGALHLDVLITVCSEAVREMCPRWPGHPVTGHWSIPDPIGQSLWPNAQKRAFREAFAVIEARIDELIELSTDRRDIAQFQQRIKAIGCFSPKLAISAV